MSGNGALVSEIMRIEGSAPLGRRRDGAEHVPPSCACVRVHLFLSVHDDRGGSLCHRSTLTWLGTSRLPSTATPYASPLARLRPGPGLLSSGAPHSLPTTVERFPFRGGGGGSGSGGRGVGEWSPLRFKKNSDEEASGDEEAPGRRSSRSSSSSTRRPESVSPVRWVVGWGGGLCYDAHT